MLKFLPECKEEAKKEKLYLIQFSVDGRHVPQVLTTGKVGGGVKMELSGSMTRKQYKAFLRWYFKTFPGHKLKDALPEHRKYIAKMEKMPQEEKRRRR